MKQIYMYSFLLVAMLFFATPATAQVSEEAEKTAPQEMTIEGLSVFPNPAPEGKVYIETKNDKPKRVEIHNALGKVVLSSTLTGKELNISSLESGIYIMRIREGNNSAARKLVIP